MNIENRLLPGLSHKLPPVRKWSTASHRNQSYSLETPKSDMLKPCNKQTISFGNFRVSLGTKGNVAWGSGPSVAGMSPWYEVCSRTSYYVFFSSQVCILLGFIFEILMFCMIWYLWIGCIIGIIHIYLTDNKLLHLILFWLTLKWFSQVD